MNELLRSLCSGMRTTRKTATYYWLLACAFDRFEPDFNKIYVFSENNPYRIPFQVYSRLYWKGKYENKGD
jgi:hypothetical protein